MTLPQRAPPRVIPLVAVAAEPQLVSLYEKQKKIYPRSVHGWFARWRWALVWLTQLLFYGLPWLSWNGRLLPEQIHLLATYVWGLSQPREVAAK